MRNNNKFAMSCVILLVLSLTGCTKALYKNWDSAGEEESLKSGYVSLGKSVEYIKYKPEKRAVTFCINIDVLKSQIHHNAKPSIVSNLRVSSNYSELTVPPLINSQGEWSGRKPSSFATLNLSLENTNRINKVRDGVNFVESDTMTLIDSCELGLGEYLPVINNENIYSQSSSGPLAVYNGDTFESIYYAINTEKYVITPKIYILYDLQEVDATQKYILRGLIVIGTPLTVATDAVFTVVAVGCIFTLGNLSGGLLFPMCMSAWPF